MQNSDTGENNETTDNKFETWPTQPSSLEVLPTLAEAGSNQELADVDKNSRAIHSDPEERQVKAKTRSRFSSAIRKLSRSTRKKDKSLVKGASVVRADAPSPPITPPIGPTASSEPVLSSDADDLPPDNQVKTKKKKKSLFGLKKSKVAPKKDSIDLLPPQTARVLEPLFQDTENEVIVTTERLSPTEGKRKVQITIKSKKIEKVASTEKVNESPSSPSPQEPTLSLSPTTAITSTPSTTPNSTPPLARQTPTTSLHVVGDDDSADKKKKLKAKIKTQTSQKPNTAAAAAATTAQAGKKEQRKAEEKILITQSSKDTPPRDKAPAKPSRLATAAATTAAPATTSRSTCTSSSGGAVRKTATTTRAAIKLVTAAKSKKKSATEANKASTKPGKGSAATTKPNASGNTADTTTTTSSANTTTSNVANTNKESDLMLNPQRGHRFPRPTSIESTDKSHESLGNQAITTPPTSISPITTLPTTTSPNKDLEQPPPPLSLSSLSPTPSPSPPPSTPPNSSSQPQTIEIQSGSSLLSATNASLLLAKPINQPSVLSHQQQQHPQSFQDNSVNILASNQTDDHISLAESVQPSEASDKDTSDTNLTHPAVRFTLGNRVRPPLVVAKQLGYEPSSQEPYSIEQHSDDDSDSSNSDENRLRRIRYSYTSTSITEPTLYDEFNNLELKRKHFRYQSGVSDLSLDSHNEDIQKLDTLNQMPAFGDLTMDQEMEPTIMTTSNAEKREHLYKILVIGELGTGKTSFIKRYVHQFFSQNYRATIGVDFALKVLHWDPNTIVRLQLWDIAGQERFGNMTRVYYKEAVGAFIVFDVTRSGTFDCVSKWKEDLDSKVQLPDGSPIPCILLANKCDQDKQGVVTNAEKMDEYVKEHGFAGWFETSAKENINIDEAARALVNKILLNDKLISAADLADSEKFNLNNSGGDQSMNEEKSKCSC